MNRSVRRARTRPALAAVLGAALAIAIAACLPGSIRPTPGPTPTPPPGPTTPPPPTPPRGRRRPRPGRRSSCTRSSRGDTLTRIARRFQTSTRSLSYWNREAYPSLDPESAHYRPDRLELGWTLRVLPGKEYVAPPDDGETGIQVTPTPDDRISRTRRAAVGP